MTKEQSIKRLLYSEFDKSIEGADIYEHLGCKWVIFTNERKWIVEFTKERILWFNYRHFNDIVVLFGMDCYEGSDYIKEWFETRFILIEDIKKIFPNNNNHPKGVIDTIQNGVKETVVGEFISNLLGMNDPCTFVTVNSPETPSFIGFQ